MLSATGGPGGQPFCVDGSRRCTRTWVCACARRCTYPASGGEGSMKSYDLSPQPREVMRGELKLHKKRQTPPGI